MSLFESIPKLDLTPVFDRPALSPGRLSDYWQLFRDVLYFPQKLRDYVQLFAQEQQREANAPHSWSWGEWMDWFGKNPIQSGLAQLAILLSLILLLFTVGVFGLLIGVQSTNDIPFASMAASFIVGLLFTLIMIGFGLRSDNLGALVAVTTPTSVALTIWLFTALTPLTSSWRWTPWEALLLTFVCGVSFGVVFSITFALAEAGLGSPSSTLLFSAAIGVLIGLSVLFVAGDLFVALVGGGGALLGCVLGVYRPDDWVLGALRMGDLQARPDWRRIPHVTSLPFGALSLHLKTWLEFDWKRGLDNAVTIWRYSGQQDQIRRALHEILGEAKDDGLMEKVARLADAPQGAAWGMVTYGDSLRRTQSPKKPAQKGAGDKSAPKAQRQRARQRLRSQAFQPARLAPVLPTASPAEAVVAGFWYLAHGYPAAARDAFKKGPSSPLGKEMIALAEALAGLQSEENLLANSAFKFPERPSEPKRKATWEMLARVSDLVKTARLQRQCISPEKRTAAAEIARRLRSELAAHSDLPHVEMRLIRSLADAWEKDLDEWLASSDMQPLKAIANPFIFAEPLRDKRLHVNREAELAALKEAWAMGNLQTVFIYGQPLVGKTSLLYNAELANRASVQLAWFRLGHLLGEQAPLPQVLSAICIAVRDATMLEVTVFSGDDSYAMPDVEKASDPYAASETFIRRACRLMEPHSLILVLDDYDALERAFANNEERDQLLGFLWHLYQAVRNFNVVFVSLRSPILFFQSRTTNPFASTARALVVRNLDKDACRKLLRAPVADFPLLFSDDAIDAIYMLSGGHPYFVQLIAYRLVQRFNFLAQRKQGEPLLETSDVEAIVGSVDIKADEEYLQRSRQFYMGMGQLTSQVGSGVATLLQTIADDYPHTTTTELAKKLTPVPAADRRRLDDLLTRLQRYGVIEQEADTTAWRIQIELWRRWITHQQPLLTAQADEAKGVLTDSPHHI